MNAKAKPSYSSPLVLSLNSLEPRKDLFTAALYVLIGLAVLISASLPFCSWTQKAVIDKFHLTTRPFERWAAFQFIPSMYNFHNEFIWSYEPGSTAEGLTVNHYPLRMIMFTTKRGNAVSRRPVYIDLRSSYRGRERTTSYLLATTPQYLKVQYLNTHERIVY